MKKSDLITSSAAAVSLPKATIEKALEGLTAVTRTALHEGQDVVFGDIGKLSTVKRAARTATNPSTGAKIDVPAKTVVKFKPAKSLSDAVA